MKTGIPILFQVFPSQNWFKFHVGECVKELGPRTPALPGYKSSDLVIFLRGQRPEVHQS
jgi:hypothetical protein